MMSEIEDKVAKLEATEKELQAKQAELDKSNVELEEKNKQKAALELELGRVRADITKEKETRRQKDLSFEERTRNENLALAKTKFFGKFQYTKEEQDKFLEDFKRFDSNAVSSDLIYLDLLKAHVARNPEKYISLEERVNELSKGSEELKAALSSAGFAAAGGLPATESEGLTKDELQAAQWAGLPPKEYKRLKEQGKIPE